MDPHREQVQRGPALAVDRGANKTLEEIAAAFGDRVVSLTDRDLVAEQTVFEEKAAMSHVEKSDDDHANRV